MDGGRVDDIKFSFVPFWGIVLGDLESSSTRIFLAGRTHTSDEVERHLTGRVVAVSSKPSLLKLFHLDNTIPSRGVLSLIRGIRGRWATVDLKDSYATVGHLDGLRVYYDQLRRRLS